MNSLNEVIRSFRLQTVLMLTHSRRLTFKHLF